MTVYLVTLAITKNGTTIGTTEDAFEASSAAQAEADAIAAWKALEPHHGFRPLLVVERR